MFSVQLAVSALVWAGTILILVRRKTLIFGYASSRRPGQRAALAAGALVLSVVVLALGMGMLALGGLGPRGLSWWGWPTITLIGSAFVVLQTLGLVPLILNAVTTDRDGSSDTVDLDLP